LSVWYVRVGTVPIASIYIYNWNSVWWDDSYKHLQYKTMNSMYTEYVNTIYMLLGG